MAEILTATVFALHIAGGAVALVAGLIALCARKGGRLHRAVGDLFVVAMLVMTVFAAALGAVRPGQTINIFIAAFTLYLVVTAWLTARRGNTGAGAPEKIALAASLLLCAPFALIIFQIVSGVILFKSALGSKARSSSPCASSQQSWPPPRLETSRWLSAAAYPARPGSHATSGGCVSDWR